MEPQHSFTNPYLPIQDRDAVSNEDPIQVHDSHECMNRKLKHRHIQMIAIGGTIGTGLFLRSGANITLSGAIGTLLAYVVAGLTVYCVVMALGEMATFTPVSGSFNEYAARYYSASLGFTSAWIYWFQWAVRDD